MLGGGSKGNATYVEAGNTRLLIDAGFSGREIESRLAALGVEAAQLSAILISHEHSDHIRGGGGALSPLPPADYSQSGYH